MPRKPYGGKVIESTLLLSVAGIRLPTHPLKPRIPSEDVNPGLKPSNDSETDMTGAHSQEKGLFSGIEKPLTQPLRVRILSARRIKSGFEAAKRQRSGHVVHMTGA